MTAPARLDPASAEALVDTRFTVPGIRCAGCIAKIERELPKLDGIASARVNFSAKRVAIRHAESMPHDALTNALEQLGFEAQELDDNPLGSEDAEAKRLQRALAVAGFGMMNVMLLSVSVWSGAGGVTRDLFHWLSGVIALPVIAYAGQPFFRSAWMALKYRRTNMDVPISIGVLLATALSMYETVAGGGHAYFESAVMLLFFLLAGRALDAAMRTRTRAGIGALLSRMGRSAMVIAADGSFKTVASQELKPGMTMAVAAGEALAADGVVEQGASAVDNAMLTGESTPERVAADSPVYAGAVNLSAPLRVRVTAAASNTLLAEIARLMDEAGQSRSRYVRIADRASRLYAPAVHTLALLAFVGWMLAGAGWHQSLVIAIAVLIITCPCAMGLAVPAAQVVTSGALLKRGLLVKDGSALERLAEVDIALFDKTGTLTLGTPRADISGLDPEARAVALALSQASNHPLSKALASSLREAGVEAAEVTDISEQGGEGLFGTWRGIEVALERPDCAQAGLSSQLRIGMDTSLIDFHDPLRADAKQAIDALSEMGIESRILSGDRSASVSTIARKLGLHARAGASPQDKLATLEHLREQSRNPLMIGDGINDGPALAAAHASIAPGSASDVSQQAADAVFTGRALMPVATAIRAARACMRVVRQNFGFAIIYNVFAVPLALFGMVTPLIAAIAMSASSIVVVANSLRLARVAR
ncbi:heavy metal translocating P-type ATPase [Aurantiacibacter sp. MUD61]|uniref:heavy metal translocating P-type ATPase n=1 Tax=Aurantiacibacter sp. MUD61 TaxID=3009083 RepID=UPI0022F04D89|nr:heavy metal translocating P-type ATPase [Aurantiacibacter sp. MUD61]